MMKKVIRNRFFGKNFKCATFGRVAFTLACLASMTVRAGMITFSGGTGSNPYYEGGFEVQLLSGPLSIGPGYVNLPGGSGFNPDFGAYGVPSSGELEVQVVGGNAFTFAGFDLAASPLDVISYAFTGQLNGVTVASGNGSSGNSYPNPYTFHSSGSSAQIDSLLITLNENPEDPFSSAQLTDINVNALASVPDQASTVGLLSVALVPLLAAGIRRRAASA